MKSLFAGILGGFVAFACARLLEHRWINGSSTMQSISATLESLDQKLATLGQDNTWKAPAVNRDAPVASRDGFVREVSLGPTAPPLQKSHKVDTNPGSRSVPLMAGAAAIPEPVMDQPHIPFIAPPAQTPEPIQSLIVQAAPIQAPSVRSIPLTQSTAAAQTPAPQAATPEPITSTTTLENASLAMKRLGKAFGGKRVH
jgi:hypothetical protein